MIKLRRIFLFFLAASLLATTASASANPLAACGDVTERDVAVAIPGEGIVVPLSETAGIRFADGGVEAQWGRLFVRTYPTVTFPDDDSFEREATFTAAPDLAENTVTYTGDESRMTYEVYESLLKETIVLDRPGNVSYRYEIGLTDWMTEERICDGDGTDSENETCTENGTCSENETCTENGTEIRTYRHTEPAEDSTWEIARDNYGNLVISINGAETVVLPRPYCTDADGIRYDLEYTLNTDEKTITITGIPESARYPLTIDPTERVINGGFETGDLTGWNTLTSAEGYVEITSGTVAGCYGRLPRAHSGTYGLKVAVDTLSHTSSYAIARQNVDFQGAENVTFWRRFDGHAPSGTAWELETSIGSNQIYSISSAQYPGACQNHPYAQITEAVPDPTATYTFEIRADASKTSGPGSVASYWDDISVLGATPPIADFTASPTSGAAPLTVQFTDMSTGSPTSWAWDFGDTGTSTDQHPTHIYSSAGTYTVTLNVSNAYGCNISAQPLITVTSDQTVMNPTPSFASPNTLILREGKNFVSTPYYLTSGHNTAGTVFPDFGTAVRGYRFENGQTVILTAQDEIRPLEGYIIYSDGYHEITLQFEDPQIRPTVTKDLDEGWNFVGFYGLSQECARDTLISLGNAWSEAKGWDAGLQEYETAFVRDSTGDTSDQRLMFPGKAYLVYMTEERTLFRSYYRTYSFCAEWVGDYHGMQNPLPSAEEEAQGFYDTLDGSSLWTGQFINGNAAAMERHWKDPAFGGVDSDYIDNTHLAYFTGHGWEGGFVFGTAADDYDLNYSEARWGNTKTDWIVLGSCNTLNASTCREYWGPAFEGLHSICSFDTIGGNHPDMGWYFAQQLMRGKTIWQAWSAATDQYVVPNDGTLRSAILAADIDGDLSTPDCLNDHIYGYGSSINPPGDPLDFQYKIDPCEWEV
ncbi:MAG: DUF6345 domain-containing protein [Methanoculleus sp.]|jgi:PKD repeat protein|uniref:DUF6345 domain-containing protein n=1 Tax=unclassified Methanoculleus TaxID=2619537 RepID=UPI0025DF4398|nr:DUF6345 domain-containing protein [Methanoculleus sp. UBA377]MDD2472567.1 DUF6345 domain-containing protein [Methanoculleus sp.]